MKNYLIKIRYLVSGRGWVTEDIHVLSTYEQAARRASLEAHRMDAAHEGSAFDWTVELHDDPKGPHGAYFQLFHGRLS